MATFNRLDASDFVISADAISSTCWTNGNPTLTEFYTSSVQANGSSGDYYINVYQTASALSASAVQFAIAYGNAVGSGSANYNNLVNGASPTSTVYGQYQVLVIGDENTDFVFGNVTGSEFFALSIERSAYKESLFLGSMTLKISGSGGVISLTDNSNYVASTTFTSAGRVYQLITGSTGIISSTTSSNTSQGYSANSGSYGWFLPDIGTILLNPMALAAPPASGGINLAYSGSYAWGTNVAVATASTAPNVSPNTSMFQAISASGASYFQLNSQETISSDFVFVRPKSNEYNYSENPSFISGSTGEVLYSSFINNPTTYITTVGLYNDANELLAVAKLSRPLPKDFTTEALIRVKLDF
jgi:hypothetical protein